MEFDEKKDLDVFVAVDKDSGKIAFEDAEVVHEQAKDQANALEDRVEERAEVIVEAAAVEEAYAHLGDDQRMVKRARTPDPDNVEFEEGMASDFVPDSAVAAAEMDIHDPPEDDYFAPLDNPPIIHEEDDDGEPPPSGGGDDDDDDKKPTKNKKPRRPSAEDYEGVYNPD
jgi:hypothetical protein